MKRNIKLLALFNFFTDFKFHSAILVLYFAKVTGSYALAMSIFSVAMVSSALFEVPTGIFSDAIGRKRTILLGAFFAVLSAIFYATGVNYWFLFVGALCEGLSRSWYSGNNDALLHDTLAELGKKDSYDHYLGKLSSMFQIALAIGAAVGSVMAYQSFALVMWASVIPQAICLVLALRVAEPPKHTRQSANVFSYITVAAKNLWRNKKLRLLSLQDIISYGIGESTFNFRAAFVATLWPVWAIGFAKMFSYLAATLSFWFSGRIIKKFGGEWLLLWARVYSRGINMISLAIPTVLSPIIMSSTALWYGITSVTTNALMQKEFSDTERATMSSLNSLIGNLFFGVASLLLGYLADITSPAYALFAAEIVSMTNIYITWRMLRYRKK